MKVLCYGDSNTYGYDSRSYFGDRYPSQFRWVDIMSEKTGWTFYNEGVNGREIPQRGFSVPHDIDLVIIMLGTNDLLQGKSLKTIERSLLEFIVELNAKQVLLISPPLLQQGAWVDNLKTVEYSRRLAEIYDTIAKQAGILFVDAGQWDVELLYDGVHFSEKGHISFADGLYHFLMKGD